MSSLSHIKVPLTQELSDALQSAIGTGEYATESEILLEALAEWRARRQEAGLLKAEIRQAWEAGVASGPGRFASFDAIKAEARRRRQAASLPPD